MKNPPPTVASTLYYEVWGQQKLLIFKQIKKKKKHIDFDNVFACVLKYFSLHFIVSWTSQMLWEYWKVNVLGI